MWRKAVELKSYWHRTSYIQQYVHLPGSAPANPPPTHPLRNKFNRRSRSRSLFRLRRRESLDQGRIPNIRHLLIPTRIRMHAIAQVGRRKPSVLVHDPDGRLGLVEPCGPGRDLRVELLDLGVVRAYAHGDDLGDLRRWKGLLSGGLQGEIQE